jgi:hypothetical protein
MGQHCVKLSSSGSDVVHFSWNAKKDGNALVLAATPLETLLTKESQVRRPSSHIKVASLIQRLDSTEMQILLVSMILAKFIV